MSSVRNLEGFREKGVSGPLARGVSEALQISDEWGWGWEYRFRVEDLKLA